MNAVTSLSLSPSAVRHLAIALVAAAGVGLTPGLPGGVRVILVLPFFLVAPGLGWAFALPLRGTIERLTAAVALSLAFDVLIAQALLAVGVLSTLTVYLATALVTLVGVVVLGLTIDREVTT